VIDGSPEQPDAATVRRRVVKNDYLADYPRPPTKPLAEDVRH
jgi:hypothetical protein